MKILLSANKTKQMSRSGRIRSAQLTYLVQDADPEKYRDDAVLFSVISAAPPQIGAAVLQDAEITRCHGAGNYEVEVSYKLPGRRTSRRSGGTRKAGDKRWFIDSSIQTEHILTAWETVSYGESVPTGNLINWNGKHGALCSVNGTSRLTAFVRENCILTMEYRSFNARRRKKIAELTGKVNSESFHNWAAGEVLFLGASSGDVYVNEEGDELLDVNYRFAIRPNRNDMQVNNCSFNAGGWDVVWPLEDTSVHVSRIYPLADFKALGIGD